jgi:hypothetical protein
MNSNNLLHTYGLSRIDVRVASALLSALSVLTVVAGIAASTQAQATPVIAKPIQFISDDVAQGALAGGRSAHRLCRSPIRFLGTAEPRQVPDCKRVHI